MVAGRSHDPTCGSLETEVSRRVRRGSALGDVPSPALEIFLYQSVEITFLL